LAAQKESMTQAQATAIIVKENMINAIYLAAKTNFWQPYPSITIREFCTYTGLDPADVESRMMG
jgi:hypothetical protein